MDLKTGELRAHSRADRITRLVESEFDVRHNAAKLREVFARAVAAQPKRVEAGEAR